MKILLWLLFLCILLFFNLGNVIIPMETIPHTPKKYKNPTDYYSDVAATQGVFSVREGFEDQVGQGQSLQGALGQRLKGALGQGSDQNQERLQGWLRQRSEGEQGQQTEAVTEDSEPQKFGQIIKGGKIYRGQLQPRKMGVI